ncbi:MAG: hypothetical protein IPO29_16270 [Anaerolineae bacterium]|nr:hypothetical protein [Anaerolineae bacterium]
MTIQPEFARHARRWARLLAGLVAFGVGIALMKHSDLGLGPWEVLNDGLSRITGVSLGTVGIVVGVPILLLWLPLRERPGIGTILNIIVIGVVINEMLRLLPPLAVFQALTPGAPFLPQGLEMALGIGVIGFATALYLGANLGAGPRDGLMMGLTRRTGWSLRLTRTLIEVVVLAIGWLLGGSVGVGTLAFALCIGPVVQAMFALTRTPDPRKRPTQDA